MKERTATDHPGERMEDRSPRPLTPLNWDETPSSEQMRADAENLEAFRTRIRSGSLTMLTTLREQLGLDPLQVVMTQKFDLDGSITMTARAIADPMALTTLRGKVIEVGNLDGDTTPGVALELAEDSYLTILGLSEEQARAIAPSYAGRIEIIIRALPPDPERIARFKQSQ